MTPDGWSRRALPVGSSTLFETTANQCAFHGVGERANGLCASCCIVLAVEALRKARATMDCLHVYADNHCLGCSAAGSDPSETWELAVISSLGPAGIDTPDKWDARAASALLDGFSVDEVTAAEEVLA